MKRSVEIGEELRGTRGTYEIQEHIDEGGFAKAWIGVTPSGDKFCIKHPNFDSQMDNETIAKYFDQERQILSDLQSKGGHKNVVEFIESFTVDSLPILIVELVEGKDGYSKVRTDGAIRPETVRSIGIELSEAARFIHRHEHINRDLKPENFILKHSDVPVLVDFNTARGFDEDKDPDELDASSTKIPGRFKPPEVKSPETADFRQGPWSDVYSIGKILFYLLKQSVPKNEHGLDIIDFNTSCPDYLAGIIEKATQEHYADRYRNAQTLKLVLENKQVQPPKSATLVRQETNEDIEIAPGDTIGRVDSNSPATITVSNPENGRRNPISSVQVEFDLDSGGNWVLKDRSLNGTWVHRGTSRGWIRVLSIDGRNRLENKGYDPTLDDGTYPPISMQLQPSDRIVLVHPEFDVTYKFYPD